ncbi:hypothetical protein P775_11015 [Puniceibacterium antarcticum]|uniref:Tip attachment protein J HDII-ins2 domain-containing protein n=2 Tax=Puniceibacterium antarcticum TaxID=1206336 RepID=A0A2G8RFL5_9RHOB|nr:hypothetical protein P775_11015 [Puniceibacterium antarcticum]
MFNPGKGRIDLELPCDMTIAEIVATALPGLSESARRRVRVMLVTDRGMQIVPLSVWHMARPLPGVQVVLRVVPGNGALKSILTIVVAVAAVALAATFAGPLAAALSISPQLASGIIVLATTAIGNLAISSLFPPPEPDSVKNRYAIAGFRNEMRPDGAVPEIMGTIRYSPPFATSTWSEIIGDIQYVRTVFLFGGGHVALSDIRLGDTLLEEFDEVETEVQTNVSGDTLLDLYPWQIVEERFQVELVRPWPTDDAGNKVDGPSVETPIIRTTGRDAASASVIFYFPGGLIGYNSDGDKKSWGVSIRIEQRADNDDPWEEVATLSFRAKQLEAFFRQHTWNLPYRGRWKVRVIFLSDPKEAPRYTQKCAWVALQTIRPEKPIAFTGLVTKVGFRARATAQFNGQIDNFNALASRICLDWDYETEAWVERATSNPASHYRLALQSPANPKPVPDDEIDLVQLQDWHDFCRIKDLKFDYVFEDEGSSLRDALTMITSAGRASPRRDGVKWGVVIDRPQTRIIGELNPRVADELTSTRSYFTPPHAFRIKFKDASDDYNDAERIVRWPGYEGLISLTEVLEIPGKTDPAEIAREATRRAYELIYRPDIHQAIQAHGVGAATRGDLMTFSNHILSEEQSAARVRAVEGTMVVLDDRVSMQVGNDYVIRFRHYPEAALGEEADTAGQSVVRPVRTAPGETSTLLLLGSGLMPVVGDVVQFGPAAMDSFPVVVRGIEAGENFSSIYHMVAHAPIIDEMIDAYVPPAWTGRVGDEVAYPGTVPTAPNFVSLQSGLEIIDDETVPPASEEPVPRDIRLQLLPGKGSVAVMNQYRIEHRLTGASEWSTLTVPVSEGGATISGYLTGADVSLRAFGISIGGIEGPASATVAITVGQDDPAFPAALAGDAVTVTGGLGTSHISIVTGSDSVTTGIQLYRVPDGTTLDRDLHAIGAPIPTSPGTTLNYADGDATRTNLLANSVFDSAGAWTPDANWSVSGGNAQHSSGTSDTIRQAVTLTAGKVYRVAFFATVTAGSVTPVLFGGTDQQGNSVTSTGTFTDRIEAVFGNAAFGWLASITAELLVDDAVLFVETSGCINAGSYTYFAEPVSVEGVPGALSGPYAAEIL